MKAKSFYFEAYTISETARRLGYKSTKTIYRLLKRYILEDYMYIDNSGRIYLILEPPNRISLKKKILDNIQIRKNNTLRKRS
tara:strand:- start:18 stop:263 length:246 start_codon:yes stop_codon:yes gene_type:complete